MIWDWFSVAYNWRLELELPLQNNANKLRHWKLLRSLESTTWKRVKKKHYNSTSFIRFKPSSKHSDKCRFTSTWQHKTNWFEKCFTFRVKHYALLGCNWKTSFEKIYWHYRILKAIQKITWTFMIHLSSIILNSLGGIHII